MTLTIAQFAVRISVEFNDVLREMTKNGYADLIIKIYVNDGRIAL